MTQAPPDRAPVVVRVAMTDEERLAWLAPRYRVRVEESTWDIPTADRRRRLDRTVDDDSATHIFASCNDVVIGTMRLHHGATTEVPGEYREACELHRFRADTPVTQTVAIRRLVLDARQRGDRRRPPCFRAVAAS